MQYELNQIITLEDHSEVKGTVQNILPATHPNLPEDAHFTGLYYGDREQPLQVFYSESWRTWFPMPRDEAQLLREQDQARNITHQCSDGSWW